MFPIFQSGYRVNYSTETALVKLTNDLFLNTTLGSQSVVVSLDLSAAFDCISHRKLLDRLQDVFNVSDLALKWLESYLINREMFVKVCNEKSDTATITSGVPQGSVLGPLLFITYISPIEQLIKSFNVDQIAYADDLTLYINLSSNNVLNFSKCLEAVSDWLLFNDLLLNPDKSQCLRVGTRHQLKTCADSSMNLCGTLVPYSDTLKLLGVTFDSTLSFDKHVSLICSSAFFKSELCDISENKLMKIQPKLLLLLL